MIVKRCHICEDKVIKDTSLINGRQWISTVDAEGPIPIEHWANRDGVAVCDAIIPAHDLPKETD